MSFFSSFFNLHNTSSYVYIYIKKSNVIYKYVEYGKLGWVHVQGFSFVTIANLALTVKRAGATLQIAFFLLSCNYTYIAQIPNDNNKDHLAGQLTKKLHPVSIV